MVAQDARNPRAVSVASRSVVQSIAGSEVQAKGAPDVCNAGRAPELGALETPVRGGRGPTASFIAGPSMQIMGQSKG